jgi:hypothetical protein
MADSIQARITANLKTALQQITVANGYSNTVRLVEEMRAIFDIDETPYIMIQENFVEYNEDFEHTGDVNYKYTFVYINGLNDEAIHSNNPFTYQNRNAAADMIKAIMVDRTRGQIALNTVVESSGPILYDDVNGNLIPATILEIRVECHINSDNPYQLA